MYGISVRKLALLVLLSHVCSSIEIDLSKARRYLRFPVGRAHDTQCHDYQTGRNFAVGAVWSTPYSGCKESRCVKEDHQLFIDRLSCPSIKEAVDFERLKTSGYRCRQSWGDRRNSFPDCCPRLQCKQLVGGKLVPLPKELYPLL